jgi:glycine cleavage system H lipoate-binding protein
MADDLSEQFELTIDKFTFRFPKDLHYNKAGLWVRLEDSLVRIELSDFAQQRNGDIAFAILARAGTVLDVGDEMPSIETQRHCRGLYQTPIAA